MKFLMRPPADNRRGPGSLESVLHLLHRANTSRQGINLYIQTDHGEVGLRVDLSEELRALFREAFQDAYPGTSIAVEPVLKPQAGYVTWSRSLRLSPDLFSLSTEERTHGVSRNVFDPLGVVCSALKTGRSGRIESAVRLTVRPASEKRVRSAKTALKAGLRLSSPKRRRRYLALATDPTWWRRFLAHVLMLGHRSAPAVDTLSRKPDGPVYESWLTIEVTAPPDAADVARRKLREIAGAFGPFATSETRFVAGSIRTGGYRQHSRAHTRGFLLTPAEVAALWHPLVVEQGSIARVERSRFREIEPPVMLPSAAHDRDVTTFGRVLFRNQHDQFGIRMDDLRRHLLVVGKTGCGKSTLLANIVAQQMEQGRGVVLIDPHGQLVEDVLAMVPRRRTNDVILLDTSDRESRVGFNPLRGSAGTDPALVADGVVTSFMNVFRLDAGSAPRMFHILRNSLLSLVGRPDASLLAIQRLLVDARYRKSVTAQVENPVVRSFWTSEFGQWSERDRTEYIASLQNKLGAFLTNERLQNIFDPARKGIELRTILDRSQILLCNLSRGLVGQDASTLLGSLLLSSLHVAAMSRANIPEGERRDSVAVVDEIHSYLAEGNAAVANALAESRKYRVSYVLATQLLEQLDPQTLAGVLGNCGSTLAMTVGPRDAAVLSEMLAGGLTAEDLMQCPKYHGYLRLLVDGAACTLSMRTQSPSRVSDGRAAIVRTVARERFGKAVLRS